MGTSVRDYKAMARKSVALKQTPAVMARKSEVIRLHTECNMGATGIAKRVGCNKALAKKWLVKAGVYRVGGRSSAPIEWRGKNNRVKREPLPSFNNEWRGAHQWDDCAHWKRHPECQVKWKDLPLEIRQAISQAQIARKKATGYFVKRNAMRNKRYKTDPQFKAAQIAMQRKSKAKNPAAYRAKRNAYRSSRMKHDPAFRMRVNISKSLRDVIGKNLRATKRLRLYLGCDDAFLRQHIQSQFTIGMNWNNYGAWHVDHILPQSLFNHNDPEQVKICWNWQNLRPLWAKDNEGKGDTITHPQQPLPLSFG